MSSAPEGTWATVSTIWVRALVELAAQLGADRVAILRKVGLEPGDLDDREARIPVDVEAALWHAAARATGDGEFGLHLAERAPMGAFEVLDYAAQASPTLGEALARMVRYQRAMHAGYQIEIVRERDRVLVQALRPWSPALSRHALEGWAAAVVLRGRALTGLDWSPLQIDFPHPAPPRTGEHRRIFHAPVRFDGPATRIHLEPGLLERRVVTADQPLCDLVDDYARARVSRLPASPSLVEHVRALLGNALAGGDPSLSAVAKLLHLHPRVLQRRLRERGTSHQQLLDETRRTRAAELLASSDIAICEVAYLLGYAEPSAFHRAFKRWTGRTPVELRRERGAGEP